MLEKVYLLLLPGGWAVLTQPSPDPYRVTFEAGGEVLHSEMVLEPNFTLVVETALHSYRRAVSDGLFRMIAFPGMDGENGVLKTSEYPSIDVWLEEGSTFSIDRPVLEEIADRISTVVKDRPHTVTNCYKEDLIIMEKQ